MPLLRRLRQISLYREDTVKYLRYAVGEIVLIVLGILIAVSINTRVGQNNDLKKEKIYLENLLAEVKEETEGFDLVLNQRYESKINGLKLAREYAIGQYQVEDTSAFLSEIGQGGANSRGSILGSDATFQDLISTGNLNLIRNQELKRMIQDYYRRRSFVNIYIDNLRTSYADFINAVRPYDPARQNVYSIPPGRMANKLQTPEFLDATNQELTFGHSIHRVVNGLIKDGQALIEAIRAELE